MAVQDEIPKSRLTLRYKTEINGTPADVVLPLRQLITGDFSGGSSVDAKLDLEERQMHSMDGTNTDSVMKEMGIKLNFAVPNHVDPANGEDVDVNLKIDSMASFKPDAIAKQMPKLEAILMVKRLLEESLSNVDNRKDFRKLLDELMSQPEALEKVLADLKAFEGLKLPSSEKPAE
jgi:type VI secretion system protein ImpB